MLKKILRHLIPLYIAVAIFSFLIIWGSQYSFWGRNFTRVYELWGVFIIYGIIYTIIKISSQRK